MAAMCSDVGGVVVDGGAGCRILSALSTNESLFLCKNRIKDC